MHNETDGIEDGDITPTVQIIEGASLPAFPQLSSTSSLWSSIVGPIKKLWEVPTIHLSTYYGLPNQAGRPVRIILYDLNRETEKGSFSVFLSIEW